MYEYKGNHLIVMDFDRLFEETPDAVIVNSGDTIIDDPESLKQIFYDADKKHLTDVASCDCGQRKGNYWDEPCPYCKTLPVTNFTRKLNYKYWIEIPEELPPVLHPMVFHVLASWMGEKVLVSMMNLKAPMPPKFTKVFGTGMRYFYENFNYIIETLSTSRLLPPINRAKTAKVLRFLEMYKHCLFVRKLPILNQSLHMINQKGKVTFADETMKDVMQTLVDLTCLRYEALTPSNVNSSDKNLYCVYECYNRYAKKIIVEKLISKKGFIRKNMLGARMHCTARTVITPIAGPHWGDEIRIPWVVGVSLFSLEIKRVLTAEKHYTSEQAKTIWVNALVNYDPVVHDVIDSLLRRCPTKGFPFLGGRNPSIRPGAVQKFYATVKTDIDDETTSMSPLTLIAPNADFDGDAMYFMSLKLRRDAEACEPLHPMYTMLNHDGLRLSDCVAIPDQSLVNLNAWYNDNRLTKNQRIMEEDVIYDRV